jgi:hypothetical protein
MVIGIDIDDTITRAPAFFAAITGALIDAGHRVVIITFREHSQATVDELAGWGIRYSELVCSSLDQCLEHGPNAWKAAMCREQGVDVFFDDDPSVLQQVDGETVCFMPYLGQYVL